ncbi:MAG: hypothetical protein ACREBH_02520 [Candidatus Micrarchaeaceae archaeon]
MPKVYKANNKLAIYIPFDVISAMGIKDGDDLDFLKYGDTTFLVAKKMDIVKLLSKANPEDPKQASKAYVPKSAASKGISLEPAELALLKKLDTLKYNDRTNVKVASIINSDEKDVLQALLKKGIVVPFRKGNDKESRYSIQKRFYDTFLYRNRSPEPAMQVQKAKAQQVSTVPQKTQQKAWEHMLASSDSAAYMEILESKGFLVLNNEVEASVVSAALEDSIRQGLVVGTRAFNKKFYICLRGFINRNAAKVLKAIDQKSVGVSDITGETGIEEDGVRTILYVLSESGDVTEVRRDIFRSA